MGQKIHPFGFRVGITQKHYARWFATPSQYPQYVMEDYLLRQSLYKLLPPENLPKKMEDTGETRVVHIKIERFLRNTIKIKIYAVNPGSSSSTNKKTKPGARSGNFKTSSGQNNSRNRSSQNQGSRSNNMQKNQQENRNETESKLKSLNNLVIKYKTFVNKSLKRLYSLKSKNIIYRFQTLMQLNGLNNSSSLSTKSPQIIKEEIRTLSNKISKINSYLNKLISGKTENSSSQLTSNRLEKTIVYINQNILKERLTFKILKLQTELLKSFPKLTRIMSKNFLTTVIQSKLKKVLSELSKSYSNPQTETGIGVNSIKSLFESKLPSTISLRHQLQKMLTKNYYQNFASLQSGRQGLNYYLGKFGQKRVNKSTIAPQDLLNKISLNGSEDITNLKKVDYSATEEKIYLRKAKEGLFDKHPLAIKQAIKTRNARLKRTVKKQMKKCLILQSVRTRFPRLANFKNTYQTDNLTNLCQNISKLQTLPKITQIEFIHVRTPTRYAVSLASFIVEKLEKRFSFRGTMKKAKEEAMKTPGIKGIKIQVAGRLNGAEIARTEWMRAGRVPLQTLKAKIDYSYKTASTIYGILGVKVWIFKDSSVSL
nr:ribosomal protein S3 [Chaetopeltis orbicularis]